MRKYLSLLFIIISIQTSFSQDKIFTKDKGQLNVQIIEKTDKLVRYKMLDYENGPILNIKNNLISKIEYKNGVVDLMGSQNPRKNKPLGINTGLTNGLDQDFLTVTLNYFILPRLELELSYGSDFGRDFPYFTAGTRVHVGSDYSHNRITPFSGLLVGSTYENSFFQIPLGLNYSTKKGFNASLSINNMINLTSHYVNYYIPTQTLFGELRIGWRFKGLY